MKIWQKILNFILPPRCVLCGKVLRDDQGICDSCINNVEFLKLPICYRCGQPLNEVTGQNNAHLLCARCLRTKRQVFRLSRSAFAYDDFSKKLILDFKFYDYTDLAALLAKMLYVAGNDIFQSGVDIIIPVPLHYTRLIKRKYNQSSLLAKELSKLTGIKTDNFILRKKRRTKPQVECSGTARLNNLKNAFIVKNPAKIKGKRVLLIDDVLTTGATLRECAVTLKRAGAKSVDNLTAARVIN